MPGARAVQITRGDDSVDLSVHLPLRRRGRSVVAHQHPVPHPARARVPDRKGPEPSRHHAPLSPGERIVQQARAIDAWLTARRRREQALQGRSLTGGERLDVDRELQAMRRTHQEIRDRCAGTFGTEVDALRYPGITAVVAHRDTGFADTLSLLLDERGVVVLVTTDNGAEALGAVVAEQPDLVLVGGRLAMIHGGSLLAESRRYAPEAVLAAAAADRREADELAGAADTVFLRHHAPAVVADALVARHLDTSAQVAASRTAADRGGAAASAREPLRSTRVGEWGGD